MTLKHLAGETLTSALQSNSDDSDESGLDAFDDIPQDDEEEEEKPTLYSEDEIPNILAKIESDDPEVWNPVGQVLNVLVSGSLSNLYLRHLAH